MIRKVFICQVLLPAFRCRSHGISWGFAVVVSVLLGWSVQLCRAADQERVDFNQQIRPILSDKCFHCHGPNAEDREGGFRLDDKASALGEADSGAHPIVPSDPKSSEVYQRLITDDSDLHMPPVDSKKNVTKEEIATIRTWIEQGAPWEGHWAYSPPCLPSVPAVRQKAWPRNAIDHFVLARLEKLDIKPSPEAKKAALLRRVTFDLTGLPPTPDEVAAFLADDSPDAYENVVDRLLASDCYGEHMARFWLDAARYGDTHGLHLDNYREMWPYRDWVVRSFNGNKPFDQFTIEQLAGDLLPNPTDDQRIATGFLRCHVTTNEGGSIKEEVYVRNVVDRVVTIGTVFLGSTLECTRCHDHKYDPFTMKDFYSLFAYFNSMDGNEMDGNRKDPPPTLRILTAQQKQEIASLRGDVKNVKAELRKQLAAVEYHEPDDSKLGKVVEEVQRIWVDDEVPTGAKESEPWKWVTTPKPVLSGKRATTRTAMGRSQHFFEKAKEPLVVEKQQLLFAYVYLDPDNPPKEIMMQWNNGTWEHRAYWGANVIDWGKNGKASRRHKGDLPPAGEWVRLEVSVGDVGLKPGDKVHGWAFTQFDGTVYWDKIGVTTRRTVYSSLAGWAKDQRAAGANGLPKDIKSIVKLEMTKRTDAQKKQLLDYFLQHVYAPSRKTFDSLQARIQAAEQKIAAIEKAGPTTLVFREAKKQKPAWILERGEYDQHGLKVERATPAGLPPLPQGVDNDRLGLAKWLVTPNHPLVARVTVNRFWQHVFGVGLVKTAEDFGSQGEVPSHPDLLNWLAAQFVKDGWDVKRTVKRMVMSATYCQTSRAAPARYQRDPENRLLARGPRFRLDAEMLRDQALAISGLLVEKLGGPSVKPPQPDGLWFAVGYSGSDTVRFKPDTDPKKTHRRTLYTFIKRTAPPPELSTLDAPSREACTVRRERTNTPLQALLLMNDPQFVEAARALAAKVMSQAGPDARGRATRMFQLATCRLPDELELKQLLAAYRDHLVAFRKDAKAAEQLVQANRAKAELDPSELAAWTMVANLVLNLDEVVTKN